MKCSKLGNFFLIHPVYTLKICLLNLNIFRNEEVVILGASFSGADIGLDLVKSASKVKYILQWS